MATVGHSLVILTNPGDQPRVTIDLSYWSAMLTKLLKTFRYFYSVQGYTTIPTSTFPARMGCSLSDKFTIPLTEAEYPGGVSLAEFHAAFLCSPIFTTELWILSKLGQIDRASLEPSHLTNVAMGERSCLGPWTAWALDGNRTRPVRSLTTTSTTSDASANPNDLLAATAVVPCQIMRARFRGRPFCDTWWAVELTESTTTTTSAKSGETRVRHPLLAFGTAMIASPDDSATKRVLSTIMDPLHRLYSRLLLASAKATLVVEGQKRLR